MKFTSYCLCRIIMYLIWICFDISTYFFSFFHWFKVSEYPLKQNKNMLKKHGSVIYTYFYNISLNVLRITFFNIYDLPFLRSPNIGKIRVKVGPKTNYFSYILSSCTNRIAVFNIFFHWYVANQETNKTVPAIFFFSNIFWIIYF